MILGIDLGTTKSVVGFWKDGIHIVPDCNGNLSIPSELSYERNHGLDEIYVGHASRSRANAHKIRGFKRRLGNAIDAHDAWYDVPQCASAYVLARLKLMAENYLGHDVKEAVIAIPSHFDLNQRRATLEAAEIAGLSVRRLLNEATACALAYANRPGHKELENVIVLDIGGGTTDIALVDAIDGFLSVRYIDGVTQLGGVDFNRVLFSDFMQRIKVQYGLSDIHLNSAQQNIIDGEIERVKLEISQGNSSTIYLPYLQIGGHLLLDEFEYNPKRFAELTQPLVDGIIKIIERAPRRRENLEDTSFLLVGGASRTYGLKQEIETKLSLRPVGGMDVETAVAVGAIRFAGMLEGDTECLATDILQDHYGIGLGEDGYEVLLHKNTTIPFSQEKEFTNAADAQTELSIPISKGVGPKTKDNALVGILELKGLPPSPKGKLKIAIEFNVDVNMDISVKAKLKDFPKHSVNTELKSNNGLSDDLKKFMKERVSIWYFREKINGGC